MARRLERLDNPHLFLKGYFPKEFSRPFSTDQLEAIGIIINCAKYSSDEIICAPRGDWKTETLKHLVIYLMLAEIVRFPVWIGATGENAGSSFEHIKSQFKSELLSADFPEVCDPVIALDDSPQKAKRMTFRGEKLGQFRWGAKELIFPSVFSVPGTGIASPYGDTKMTYRGLDSHVRGLNILGDRPDIAVCDDLETEESARMDGQIETRESLLDNAIGGLGSGETIPRIVLGTVQNRKCLTRKKLIEWGGKRYQAVKIWPTDDDAVALRDDYIEARTAERAGGSKTFDKSHQFYIDNQAVIERGLEIGNPHNYSRKFREDGRPLEVSAFQRVLNAASDKKWSYVYCELQNDPEDEETDQTTGLTAGTVQTRISGLMQHELPNMDGVKVTIGLDIGNWAGHWVKVAWFGDATGCIIDYGVMEVAGMVKDADQLTVTRFMIPALQQWRTNILADNKPDFCLIDSGSGMHKDAVYEFVRAVGGTPFAASKGIAASRFFIGKQADSRKLFIEAYAQHQPEDRLWLYSVNTEYWKQWVHERFVTPTFDESHQFNPGSLSLFACPSDVKRHLSFAKHIVAEERRSLFIPGKGVQTTWHVINKNNHWLDATALACAAAGCLGVRLIRRESIAAAQPAAAPKVNQPVGPNRFSSRPGGWVQGARR